MDRDERVADDRRHPFFQRLNQVFDQHGFDDFVEAQRAPFYTATLGRPSLTPGTYFRLLLIGYIEGIDSERGIAWRTADSLALRGFLGFGLDEAPPEHSTITRTRRLIDLAAHRAVFPWILQVLATADLITGETIGIDATTLEANAALRSIRRDSVYANCRRIRGRRGGTLHRRRSERLERPNAHLYETGSLRRTHLRGHSNILKRLVVHSGGFNQRLLMRTRFGIGTPRGLQGRLDAVVALLVALWAHLDGLWRAMRRAMTDHEPAFPTHQPLELLPICVSEGDL